MAVTFANRWDEAIIFINEQLNWVLDTLTPTTRSGNAGAIGKAIVALFQEEGPGTAYSAFSGFTRTASKVFKQAKPEDDVYKVFSSLLGITYTWVVSGIDDPGLLRDIAEQLRHHLGRDANDIAEAIEAASLFRASDGDPEKLQYVDPDIHTTVSALLGIEAKDVPWQAAFAESLVDRIEAKIDAREQSILVRHLDEAIDPSMPPLYSTIWQRADQDTAVSLIATLASTERQINVNIPPPMRMLHGVWTTEPSFYPGWTLAEATTQNELGQPGVLNWLYNTSHAMVITGKSLPIHTINGSGALVLVDSTSASDYLRFFCSSIFGPEGPFRLIETIDQISLAEPLEDADMKKIEKDISPVMVEQKSDDIWEASANVLYAYGLYLAHFKISSNGMVEMTDDKQLVRFQRARRIRIHFGVRFFDGIFNVDDEADNPLRRAFIQ